MKENHLASRTAQAISLLTNPAVLLVAAAGFIIYRYSDNFSEFSGWMAVAVGLLIVPGVLYSVVTWMRDGRFDIDITHREDRIAPLLLATLGALIGGYLVTERLDSSNLHFISNVLIAFLLTITVVTFIWKISLHSSTLTAMVTILTLFSGSVFSWFYLMLIPIFWARLHLKQHTPAQLIAGSLVGAGVTLVAYNFFGS